MTNCMEAREFAQMEGGAFIKCDPWDEKWNWKELSFNLDQFIDRPMITGAMSHQDWIQWLKEEIEIKGKVYIENLSKCMLQTPELLEPVVIAIHPDGTIEIGDGWHRIALAIRDDIKTIPTIIGTL